MFESSQTVEHSLFKLKDLLLFSFSYYCKLNFLMFCIVDKFESITLSFVNQLSGPALEYIRYFIDPSRIRVRFFSYEQLGVRYLAQRPSPAPSQPS